GGQPCDIAGFLAAEHRAEDGVIEIDACAARRELRIVEAVPRDAAAQHRVVLIAGRKRGRIADAKTSAVAAALDRRAEQPVAGRSPAAFEADVLALDAVLGELLLRIEVEHRHVLVAQQRVRHHVARRAEAERLVELRVDAADAAGPDRVAPFGAEAVDAARGDLGRDEVFAAAFEIVVELEAEAPEHRAPRLVDRNDLEAFLAVAIDELVVDLLVVAAPVDLADGALDLGGIERLADFGRERL